MTSVMYTCTIKSLSTQGTAPRIPAKCSHDVQLSFGDRKTPSGCEALDYRRHPYLGRVVSLPASRSCWRLVPASQEGSPMLVALAAERV